MWLTALSPIIGRRRCRRSMATADGAEKSAWQSFTRALSSSPPSTGRPLSWRAAGRRLARGSKEAGETASRPARQWAGGYRLSFQPCCKPIVTAHRHPQTAIRDGRLAFVVVSETGLLMVDV